MKNEEHANDLLMLALLEDSDSVRINTTITCVREIVESTRRDERKRIFDAAQKLSPPDRVIKKCTATECYNCDCVKRGYDKAIKGICEMAVNGWRGDEN